jgi:uncharacterized protein (DUF1800 family)
VRAHGASTPRLLARRAFGDALSATTDAALLAAPNDATAFALLLVSPEVMYR